MFTGLVEATSRVERARAGSLWIDLAGSADNMRIGDSVAVNGACLTVAEISSGRCRFDVSAETLDRTTLGDLRENDEVNIEPALRPSDRMAGHFVTGHVDGVGTIEKVSHDSLAVTLPPELRDGVVEKGSIAVDGISLTVARVTDGGFSVAIIPHTFRNTNLPTRKAGDHVNIETDIIGKHVKKLLSAAIGGASITPEKLREHGFC